MNANFQALATTGQPGGSSLLDRLVTSIQDAFGRLGSIVTNNRIAPVTFAAANTDVLVAHGLGRTVETFDTVDLNAAAIVYRSPTVPTSSTPTQKYIILRASAICRAKVRFE